MMQLKTETYLNAKLSDICLATSAAPTFLPPHQFVNDGVEFDMIDGAMAANNPVIHFHCLKLPQILTSLSPKLFSQLTKI